MFKSLDSAILWQMGLQFTGFTTVTIQRRIYVLYGAFGILFSQIIDAMLHLHGQIVLSSKLLRSVTSTEVGHIKYASSRWSLNFQYHQRFAKLAKRGRALSHCLSLSLATMMNPNPLKMMMRDRRCSQFIDSGAAILPTRRCVEFVSIAKWPGQSLYIHVWEITTFNVDVSDSVVRGTLSLC